MSDEGIQTHHDRITESSDALVREIQRTFRYFSEGSQNVYDTRNLVRACGNLGLSFPPEHQNDAAEFYDLLLNHVEDHAKDEPCSIFEYVGGIHVDVVKCTGCGLQREMKRERFLKLGVKVVDEASEIPFESLEQCLDAFVKPECMRGDNMVYCSECKSKKDATQTVMLYELPKVPF
jgi:uncharacterized UBP type Zn finger protein